ncbi:natural cytotoxicity triggering receptor 3-like [Pyxicephalus adspersus]|uniref:natural cytotoxicity triggering receptor 3-like n=1 Tax=Pyxicephalus adspersus TaxID=30357 RepID=UPI003B5C6559
MGPLQVLLFLGNLPGFLSQMIHVQQIPVIWATEGSSVTLPCYYNISGGNSSIGSFKWYRHKAVSSAEVSDNSTHFHGRVSEADLNKFISERSATITLHKVEKTDLGMYFCEVRLLFSQEISGHGNGTFLNVTGVQSVPYYESSFLYGKIAGGVLLLAVLSAIIYYIYSRQGSSSIQDGNPISYSDFMTPRPPNEAHSNPLTPQEQTVRFLTVFMCQWYLFLSLSSSRLLWPSFWWFYISIYMKLCNVISFAVNLSSLNV